MKPLYSTGDVSNKLGIAQYRLLYAIENGMVADASMRVGGKRIFTDEDLIRLAEHFEVKVGCDDVPEQKKENSDEIQK